MEKTRTQPDNNEDPLGLRTGHKTGRTGRSGNAPPAEYRFQAGKSGNPGGRPRKVLAPLLREILVADNERYAKLLVRAWLQQACTGNRTALKEALERVDGLIRPEEEEEGGE